MASTITARGSISLVIDEEGLEAKLSFAPDPKDGAEWSADKLRQLLLEHKVAGVPSMKEFESILFELAKSKEPKLVTAVRGLPPEQPLAEQFELGAEPVPEEIRPHSLEIIARAPPPLLFKIKQEKVKVERTVAKKGALPFLPPKKATEVSFEFREKKEPVRVDPQLVATAFARKGDKIGFTTPSKPGKQGKNVYGKPIPPTDAEDLSFYPGPNVAREGKGEFVAKETGIVRVGANWADIIPLPDHRWELKLASDRTTVLLDYEPGDLRFARPTGAQVAAKAVESGAAGSSLRSTAEIDSALARAASEGRPLRDYPLTTDIEPVVAASVSEDGLRAILFLKKGRGLGKELDLKMVSDQIRKLPIKGLDAERIRADVLAFLSGPATELGDYTLATGRAPGRAKEVPVHFATTFLPDSDAKACLDKLAKEGVAPPGGSPRVALAVRGQKIFTIGTSPRGAPGVDVYGRELPGGAPVAPEIVLKGPAERNGDDIIALEDGILALSQGSGRIEVLLVPRRDAKIEVVVTQDRMACYVSLEREIGAGSPLDEAAVTRAMEARGARKGLVQSAIAEGVRLARAGAPARNILVAKGRRALEHPGGVDFLEHGVVAGLAPGGRGLKLKPGDAVLERHPAGSSAEGYDVSGAVLAARRAQTGYVHDASISEESSGGLVYFRAKAEGELSLEGNRLSVRAGRLVQGDLAPSDAGPIKEAGALSVRGAVRAGVSLHAEGDVAIAGAVEAAIISSGGSVRILQGVSGGGKAIVRAKGLIEVGFADRATVMAVGDILVRGACAFCNLKSNGRVSLPSGKGQLQGGLCRAKKGIDVAHLGSERGGMMQVSFGQDYLLHDLIEQEQREIEKLQKAIVDCDRRMRELERPPAGGAAELDAARRDKLAALRALEKRSLRLFSLREKFEEHFPSDVRVRGYVYPGVVLESHGRVLEVTQRMSGMVFAFDQSTGRITGKPIPRDAAPRAPAK